MAKEYTNDWFQQRGAKTWGGLLGDKEIKRALEIGCYEGQASVWLLENYPKLELQVVDIFDADSAEDWDGYSEVDNKKPTTYEDRFDHNTKEFSKRLHKYKGKSLYWLAKAVGNGSVGYDFIYVDGDHRKLQTTQDMALAIELLAPKGIMVIDDYGEIPWVFDAVNAFSDTLDSDEYEWGKTVDGEQFFIKRKD